MCLSEVPFIVFHRTVGLCYDQLASWCFEAKAENELQSHLFVYSVQDWRKVNVLAK